MFKSPERKYVGSLEIAYQNRAFLSKIKNCKGIFTFFFLLFLLLQGRLPSILNIWMAVGSNTCLHIGHHDIFYIFDQTIGLFACTYQFLPKLIWLSKMIDHLFLKDNFGHSNEICHKFSQIGILIFDFCTHLDL